MLNIPFKSYTFRLALVYLFLFLASTFVLFGFIFYSTTRSLETQLDETIETDIDGFADRYVQSGINGIIRLISHKARVPADLQDIAVYALADSKAEIIAGTIDYWPLLAIKNTSSPARLIEFDVRDNDGHEHSMRSEILKFPDGEQLLVGRSTASIHTAQSKLIRTFLWAMLITLLLGITGGAVLSRRAVRRIERMNTLCREIMDGQFSSRLQTPATNNDDLDQLAGNINQMLDRIETLMREVIQVSDNIAHDLRTPLSHLRQQLENTLAKTEAGSEVESSAQAAIEDVDHLLDTFNALLRIAKVESGRKRESFAPLDPAEILADVAEMYEPVAEEKSLDLQLTIDSGIPIMRVMGDRNLLFQAVANLLDNAVKHTPAGGTIQLQLTSGPKPSIIVADSGPGIPQDELEAVTRRFYRLDQSRGSPGNGLGLSLVKAIASLHQAELKLRNGNPGLVAEFRFSEQRDPKNND